MQTLKDAALVLENLPETLVMKSCSINDDNVSFTVFRPEAKHIRAHVIRMDGSWLWSVQVHNSQFASLESFAVGSNESLISLLTWQL